MTDTLITRLVARADCDHLRTIAADLPEYFGSRSLMEMDEDLRRQPGFTAALRGRHVGFVIFGECEEKPAQGRFEIIWLAVAHYARDQGVGTALLDTLEAHLLEHELYPGGGELVAWTLDDSVDYPPYESTRAFYRARGFDTWFIDHENLSPGGGARLFLRKRLL